MSDSIFNPDAMLDSTYEESPPDHYTPIDEGEYLLRIKEVRLRQNTTADQRVFTVAEFSMVVEDDAVKQKLNMAEPTARFSVFLDLKADGKTLDFGTNKNVRLGQLKIACGLRDGSKWSFRHFDGCTCFGRIKQEADRNDPERIYNRVVTVAREPTATAEERSRSRNAA